MNTRHKRTLVLIFSDPVSKNIPWRDLELLLVHIGAEIIEGRGSRVSFVKNGHIASFHRPHPAKEAKPYQIKDARNFLMHLGYQP